MPASLAVATLIVCTFWGIASGLVGAVVVLMGVIAMNPMLKAGYDVKLAAGVITAGGTLGILIPPSVMIIVYAAVAGQSVVKLYAATILPGLFLAFLYLVYVVSWAMIQPKIAPRPPEEQTRVPVPAWLRQFQAAYSPNIFVGLLRALISPARADPNRHRRQVRIECAYKYLLLIKNFGIALVPFMLIAGTLWLGVVVRDHSSAGRRSGARRRPRNSLERRLQAPRRPDNRGPPENFYLWYSLAVFFGVIMIVRYYWNFDSDRFEILKLLTHRYCRSASSSSWFSAPSCSA